MQKLIAYFVMGIGLLGSHTVLAYNRLPFEGGMVSAGLIAQGSHSRYIDDANADLFDGNNGSYGNHNLITNVGVAFSKSISSRWLIGLGAAYEFNNMIVGLDEATAASVKYQFSIREKKHRSLYVQPMYVLDETTAVFGKIGYHEAKIFVQDMNGQNVSITPGLNESFSVTGPGYGLGLRKSLPYHVFIQVEGQYVSFNDVRSTAANGANARSYYAVKLNLVSGILSLGYSF